MKDYEMLADFDEDADGTQFFVPSYNDMLAKAQELRQRFRVMPGYQRKYRVTHFAIDFALTFCRSGGELSLFPSAMDDVNRVRKHIRANTRVYTSYQMTIDGHGLYHIGNRSNWVRSDGSHPDQIVVVTPDTFEKDIWLDPNAAFAMFGDAGRWDDLRAHVEFLVKKLAARGLPLTIWPIHGVLGGIDSCLVPSFFQDVCLATMVSGAYKRVMVKGVENLWEEYSPFSTGVARFFDGARSQTPNDDALRHLMNSHMLVVSGEALSHCVGMALLDMIDYANEINPELLKRVYLLQDCTSAVPGFESQAEMVLEKCRAAKINLVDSHTPMEDWPNVNPAIFAELRQVA